MTARLSISIVKIGVRGQTPLRLEISLKEPHGIVVDWARTAASNPIE
jgi:hypothetical protein